PAPVVGFKPVAVVVPAGLVGSVEELGDPVLRLLGIFVELIAVNGDVAGTVRQQQDAAFGDLGLVQIPVGLQYVIDLRHVFLRQAIGVGGGGTQCHQPMPGSANE